MTNSKVVSGSERCEETNSFYVNILFFSCFLTPTLSRPSSPLWPACCYLQKLPISLWLFIRFVSTCLNNMLQFLSQGQRGKKHFQAHRNLSFFLVTRSLVWEWRVEKRSSLLDTKWSSRDSFLFCKAHIGRQQLQNKLTGTQCALSQRKMAWTAWVSLLSGTKSGWGPEAKYLQIKSHLSWTKHSASCNHPAFNFITDSVGLAKVKSKRS